jgi:2-phospho-L-lactate guanylyltransferase
MIAGKLIWAVVPVKQFAAAKSRLAPVLDAGERAELARLMVEDVLDALMACPDILAGVAVVTSDRTAAELARRRGARIVPAAADDGINSAIACAIEALACGADDGLMVVPSDIPQVTREAFAQAAAAIAAPRSLAIAAAAEDGGTNLYACRPARVLPPRFGLRSFEQHCRAASEAGVTVHVLHAPELSLDIDRPGDLRTFQGLRSSTRTQAFLSRLRIVDRLDNDPHAVRPPHERAVAEVTS